MVCVCREGGGQAVRMSCSFLLLLAAAITTTVSGDGSGSFTSQAKKLSFSCDGKRLAVVLPGATNDALDIVRVYRYNSDGASWDQLGSDIQSAQSVNKFGTAIALSSESSNRLAIGVNVDGTEVVKIYEGPTSDTDKNAIWVSTSSDITGALSSLSSDGLRMAVATSTAIKVYAKETGTSAWNQLGGDLPAPLGGKLEHDASRAACWVGEPECVGIDCGGGVTDPHLQLGDGGSADFRGSHYGIYNMVSSSSFSLNVQIREQDFLQSSDGIEFFDPDVMQQGDKMLVHGTFMFESYTTIRTSSGRLLQLRTEATPTSPANVAFLENNVIVSKMTGSKRQVIDDVTITTYDSLVVVTTPEWMLRTSVVRGDKSYFLNIKVQHLATSSTVAPHGVIGQSFDGDGVPVNGAKDMYNSVPGGETTTTAQAEGAIEGVYTDYLMASPFATDYKFSRFGATEAVARDVRKLLNASSASAEF